MAGVESITKYISDDQTEQLKLVREIKSELAPIHFDKPDPGPVNIPELSGTLYSLYGYLGAASDEVSKTDPALAKQLEACGRP